MKDIVEAEATAKRLPEIIWEGEKVITTEVLARLYETEPQYITRNYNRNKSRFVEGKHFFKLQGESLKNLRRSQRHSQISAKARSIALWTERGAMRHAKMLETDKAWSVFETLEETYFSVREAAEARGKISTIHDRMPMYYFTIDTVLRHHLLFSRVYMLLNLFAGARRFKEMTTDQVSEVIDFCDRFAVSQDTRADWQRIQSNQVKLYGEQRQLDMIQQLLIK